MKNRRQTMNSKRLAEVQSIRGHRVEADGVISISFETAERECREFIDQHVKELNKENIAIRTEQMKRMIVNYVSDKKPRIRDYLRDDGSMDTSRLIIDLVDNITDYGILKQALEDDEIDEIRANGRYLFVEKNGFTEPYKDEQGKIICFKSTDEMDIIMRKLMGDIVFNKVNALVNGRTAEGYRIAAVHKEALSPDPIDSSNDGFNAFVLRKFKQNKPMLQDIVRKYHTMTDDMARLLMVAVEADFNITTFGPTESGKTTTSNAIINTSIPKYTRTILLQNPSEIDARKRDSSGRIINDVLHLEAYDMPGDISNTSPTMANEMMHILRLSPHRVIVGEARTATEISNAEVISEAGHSFMLTGHAGDVEAAVQRILRGILEANPALGVDMAMELTCNMLEIVVIQKKMNDGTRKVCAIAEIEGSEGIKPIIRMLYEFQAADNHRYDENDNLVEILGEYKKVGIPSKKLMSRIKEAGIMRKKYEFLEEENRPQTFNGDF